MTVVDTTILVDQLRGRRQALDYLASLSEVPICSEVTRVEILTGLRSGERKAAERLFAVVDWMPVNEEIARRAGELGRRYRRSHPGLSLADLVVGATAMELGRRVATLNVRHFPMFPRLQPPY
ncbi:MAG TPA: type II toxin-antitoxin system VapC family toxin [Candidatus Limnocylindria bacterium]